MDMAVVLWRARGSDVAGLCCAQCRVDLRAVVESPADLFGFRLV
jgi:hypothetical protein